MPALALKIIYHAFMHSAAIYRIVCRGISVHSSTIFNMQKKSN
jgi:hypothetical protein